IYILEPGLKIVDVNEKACHTTGWTRDEILGKPIKDLDHDFFADEHNKSLEKRIQDGESVSFQSRHRRKDGSAFPVDISLGPVTIGGKQLLLAIARDITERKQLEEEQNKAARLESLGMLSGGIAHDFNNILASILGNVTLVRMNIPDDSKDRVILSDAEKAILRAKDLTNQLLTFSRGGEPVRKTVAVSDLIRESTVFSLRGSNVTAEFDIADDLLPAEVDVGQFGQAVNNIVINAKQAMPEGGVLRLSAENKSIRKGENLILPEGEYIVLTFSDEGCGIPSDLLPKIFDPYFTTKDGGSGLGLATVYSIARRHGGLVTVESEAGCGATFHLYFPATWKKVEEEEKYVERAADVTGGKILIMDDDPEVRTVMMRMIEYLGHDASGAPDGAVAVELYRHALDAGEPFDVVIMDLTVPGGMGGREAAEKLLEIDPSVTMLISSGYTNDPIISHYGDYGFSGFILKPYRLDQLKDEINRALAGSSS
ncbi:MAG: PAS domain S-box protein, partial [Candidatus Latescibacteria bacterium]|nr:PAS domain S-box protein [Candidatus Latescibacterota bacterium]